MKHNRRSQDHATTKRHARSIASKPITERDIAVTACNSRNHALKVLNAMLTIRVKMRDAQCAAAQRILSSSLERSALTAIDEMAKRVGGVRLQRLPCAIRTPVIHTHDIWEMLDKLVKHLADDRSFVEDWNHDKGLRANMCCEQRQRRVIAGQRS